MPGVQTEFCVWLQKQARNCRFLEQTDQFGNFWMEQFLEFFCSILISNTRRYQVAKHRWLFFPHLFLITFSVEAKTSKASNHLNSAWLGPQKEEEAKLARQSHKKLNMSWLIALVLPKSPRSVNHFLTQKPKYLTKVKIFYDKIFPPDSNKLYFDF